MNDSSSVSTGLAGTAWTRRAPWWVLHLGLILFMVGQILYCWHQIFVVFTPDGIEGPLGARAAELPFELMVARRLYAIEAWISTVGLAAYLGITEVGPRLALWRRHTTAEGSR